MFNKTVEFYPTICYTTNDRQKEALFLAQKNDKILVVGSKNSSNTKKLFDICSAKNPHTYMVSQIDCLKAIKIIKNDRIAIVAGASTPIGLVSEVKQKLNGSQI